MVSLSHVDMYLLLADLQLETQDNGVLLLLFPVQEFRGIERFLAKFLIVLSPRHVLLKLLVFEILLIGLSQPIDGFEVPFNLPLYTLVLALARWSFIDGWFEGALLELLLQLLLLLNNPHLLPILIALWIVESRNYLVGADIPSYYYWRVLLILTAVGFFLDRHLHPIWVYFP